MTEKKTRPGSAIGSFCASLSLNMRLALVDYKRQKCLTIIAILSITICVILTMIAQGLLSKVTIVFYNSAAVTNGESDIVLSPSQDKYINGTRADEILNGKIKLMPAYRISVEGYASSQSSNLGKEDLIESETIIKIKVNFLDIEQENSIGLGIRDSLEPLNEGEAYVSKRLFSALMLVEGGEFYAQISTTGSISRLCSTYDKLFNKDIKIAQTNRNQVTVAKFKAKKFDEGQVGRFSDDPNMFYSVIISSKTALKDFSPGTINSPKVVDFLSKQNLKDHSISAIVQFPNRLDLYLNGDYNVILTEAVKLGSLIADELAVQDIDLKMPLVSALSFTKFANAGLSLTFNLILAGVILLAGYVINNIISMNINDKVYSTAIQRTVGLTRAQLFYQVFTFSLGYSFFGLLIAIPAIVGIFIYMNKTLLPSIDAGFEINAEVRNTTISVLIAVLIPLVSALGPMINLMRNNIAYSLDKEHSKTTSVKVSLDAGENAFPWTSVIVAMFSACLAIFIQIFLPLSMASLNITLFLIVFFVLLVCLLVGLLLIFINFSYLIEQAILFLLRIVFFCEKRFIHGLTEMNLVSHRIRNRKTVLIYAISLAFINFLNVSLLMQVETGQTARLRREGSSFNIANSINSKDWPKIREKIGNTDKYTWTGVSYSINSISDTLGINQPTVANRGGIIDFSNRFYGVSPNYLSYTPEGLESFSETLSSDTSLTPTELLYTRFSQNGGIVSDSVRNALFLDCKDPSDTFVMKLSSKSNQYSSKEISCTSSAVRFPGFRAYERETILRTDVVMSLDSYYSFFENLAIPFSQILNYSVIHIKTNDNSVDKQLKDRFKEQEYLYGYQTFYFKDYVARFESTTNIMNLVFAVLTAIAMILSLFSLVSTVAANIVEQTKELAIMRCLGLFKFLIARVYLYESIVVVLTGGFIGLIIGMSLGWTMISQNALFSNSVATVSFPWGTLIPLIIFSVISSFLAAFIPVYKYLGQNIVKLIKSI